MSIIRTFLARSYLDEVSPDDRREPPGDSEDAGDGEQDEDGEVDGAVAFKPSGLGDK